MLIKVPEKGVSFASCYYVHVEIVFFADSCRNIIISKFTLSKFIYPMDLPQVTDAELAELSSQTEDSCESDDGAARLDYDWRSELSCDSFGLKEMPGQDGEDPYFPLESLELDA